MSWGGRNKWPQTGMTCLRTTGTDPLTAPRPHLQNQGVRSLQKGSSLLRQPLVAPGVPGLVVMSPQSLPLLALCTPLCVPLGCPFCLKATCRLQSPSSPLVLQSWVHSLPGPVAPYRGTAFVLSPCGARARLAGTRVTRLPKEQRHQTEAGCVLCPARSAGSILGPRGLRLPSAWSAGECKP